jgi:enoyl-CoA hydratase
MLAEPSAEEAHMLDPQRYEAINIDKRSDGIVLATLDRPDRLNAVNAQMHGELARITREVDADPDVKVLVITGAGRAFCAGGDLGWIAESPDLTVDDLRTRMTAFYRTWLAVRELEVPTIAAVNGAAVGAGLCLALACDLRYAAAGARLSAPFAALGLHPGMAATWLLPEVVGVARARELLLTGRVVDAAEAAALGLVNAVVPAESLLDEVLAVAGTIAAHAPLAVRLTKAALVRGAPATFEDALAWEALAQPVTMATDDLREGIAAARERRAPRFTGR